MSTANDTSNANKAFSEFEIIPLVIPIMIGGVEQTELKMRRPKVQDRLNTSKYSGSDLENEANLFANLCGLAPGEIALLDMADYERLQEQYTTFTKARRPKN